MPERRIPLQMRYCKHNNIRIVDSVENTVWESSGNRTPGISIDHLVLKGILYDPIKHGVNFGNKLAPKSRHLPLVPFRGLPQVTFGLSSY